MTICPKCGKVAIKLVPLRDNGTGRKWCVKCKRKRGK